MHVAAGVGVVLWVAGAVLLFVVPGGLWSDIPGGALFGLGVAIEVLFTLLIVARRLTRAQERS